MILKSSLSQMQMRLATYEVYVQKWFFTSCTSCMREQCIMLIQNHLNKAHASLWIGILCIWSTKMVLWNFLSKTSWVSTWSCKRNSCHVMDVLETTCHDEQNAKRTTQIGALFKWFWVRVEHCSRGYLMHGGEKHNWCIHFITC